MAKTYNFWVYMTTNPERSALYVGMTNNLSRRLIEHFQNRGKQDTHAGKYFCYCLVWNEWHQYVFNAIEREKQLKKFTRQQKEELIKEWNPEWKFLNLDFCTTWPPREEV